jgi:hypothetical protein
VATRISPHYANAEQVLAYLIAHLGIQTPVTSYVGYWAEADTLSCYDDEQATRLQQLQTLLPANIALANSDYTTQAPFVGAIRLDERIQQAQSAVAKVLG